MTTKQCTVNGCYAQQGWGDILFCPDCRRNWTIYTKQMGVYDQQIDEQMTENLLKVFQLKPR